MHLFSFLAVDSLIFFSPFFFFALFLTLYQPTIVGPFSSLSQTLAVFLETLFLGSLLFTKILFSPVPRTLTLIIFCHFEDDTHYLCIHFFIIFSAKRLKKLRYLLHTIKQITKIHRFAFPFHYEQFEKCLSTLIASSNCLRSF